MATSIPIRFLRNFQTVANGSAAAIRASNPRALTRQTRILPVAILARRGYAGPSAPPKIDLNAPLSPSEKVILRSQAAARQKQVRALRQSKVALTKDKVEAMVSQFGPALAKGREMALEDFAVVMGAMGVVDPVQVKTIFQVFDLDGSGRVSAQELTSSLTLAMGGTPEQRRQMVFKVWDTYGKGTISKQEFVDTLVAWHRELPTRDPSQTTDWVREKATAFFDKLDTDKNGEVSFEEFDASVKRGGEGLEWLQSALS